MPMTLCDLRRTEEVPARQYASASRIRQSKANEAPMVDESEDVVDLGWKTPQEDQGGKKKRRKSAAQDARMDAAELEEQREAAAVRSFRLPPRARLTRWLSIQEHRTRLLKELSARLFRDRQLRYAERELEMQKYIMGKGAARKLRGVEKVEDNDGDDNEDDDMAERRPKKVDEKTWKPRVYKWRVERKK